MEKFFPQSKVFFLGNPIRENIISGMQETSQAKEKMGLDKNKLTILSVGGSLGSRTLNNGWKDNLDQLKEKNINPIDYYEQRLKYLLDNGYINTEKMAILRKEAEKVFKDLKDSSDDARNNNVSSKNIVNNENSDNINIKDTAIKSDLLDNFKISFNKDIYNKNYHQNEINLTNETLEDESNRNLKNKGL